MSTYKLDTSKGANALYIQVKDAILRDIKANVYKVNDTIPTEVELQEMFSVSRITIRLAINELVSEGYLIKERAKGTKVLQPKIVESLNQITHFTKEMKDKGIAFTLKSTKISIVKANEVIAEGLGVSLDDNVFCLNRIYYVDQQPLASITSYLPGYLNISVDEETYKGSLYEYLEKSKNIVISKAYEDIEVAFSNKQISKDLELADGSAVLLRTRKSFDQNGNPIELVQSYYRPEKYKYSLTFAR